MKSDEAVGIGAIARAVSGLKLHHRHAAAGLLVDDFDGEVRLSGGPRSRRAASTWPGKEQRHYRRDESLHDDS